MREPLTTAKAHPCEEPLPPGHTNRIGARSCRVRLLCGGGGSGPSDGGDGRWTVSLAVWRNRVARHAPRQRPSPLAFRRQGGVVEGARDNCLDALADGIIQMEPLVMRVMCNQVFVELPFQLGRRGNEAEKKNRDGRRCAKLLGSRAGLNAVADLDQPNGRRTVETR